MERRRRKNKMLAARWSRFQTRRYYRGAVYATHTVRSGISNCRNINDQPASNLVRLIHIATVIFPEDDRGSLHRIAELSGAKCGVLRRHLWGHFLSTNSLHHLSLRDPGITER